MEFKPILYNHFCLYEYIFIFIVIIFSILLFYLLYLYMAKKTEIKKLNIAMTNNLIELKLAKKRADMAERSNRIKSDFLANMSHEIRTPLNAIVGFAQLMGETTNDNEKIEFNNIIAHNSDILVHIIDELLTISKIEAGIIQIKIEKFDIKNIFEKTYLSFKPQAINRNIELSMKYIPFSCIVESDKDRLLQILNNLLSNAIKYTNKGGIIKMYYETNDDGVRISIKDNGIGIAKSKQYKIFHRFEKLDTFAKGTGLGLSICKAMTEKLGGKIGFDSTEGEGSLFWIWIPLKAQLL